MIKREYTIKAETGIHARPATALVQTAAKFDSEINILLGEKKASLRSILGIMSLGIKNNDQVTLEVDGKDEAEAIEALEISLSEGGLI